MTVRWEWKLGEGRVEDREEVAVFGEEKEGAGPKNGRCQERSSG